MFWDDNDTSHEVIKVRWNLNIFCGQTSPFISSQRTTLCHFKLVYNTWHPVHHPLCTGTRFVLGLSCVYEVQLRCLLLWVDDSAPQHCGLWTSFSYKSHPNQHQFSYSGKNTHLGYLLTKTPITCPTTHSTTPQTLNHSPHHTLDHTTKHTQPHVYQNRYSSRHPNHMSNGNVIKSNHWHERKFTTT